VVDCGELVTEKKTYCTGFEWSPELEDGQRWKTAGTGRTTENERWPKMENDGGGSRVVVDGGKKIGRWREGGKIWGEARGTKIRKWGAAVVLF
jgi:hypothetical protein